jgi:hypothetical protein
MPGMRTRLRMFGTMGAALAAVAVIACPAAGASTAENGAFVSECKFSHQSRNDPIALPRMRGMSHLHNFFGNSSTNARSTARKLRRNTDTTCKADDRSAYWVPALSINDQVVRPELMRAYYLSAEKNPRTIQAPPKGLKAIAGDGSSLTPQSPQLTNWSCSTGYAGPLWYTGYPNCPARMVLVYSVTFPDCWDGVHLDSPDHRSHLAYATPPNSLLGYATCPATHPVPIPSLVVRVLYPTRGATSGVELSSGGVNSGHADFINAWPQQKLEALVADGVRRAVVCA